MSLLFMKSENKLINTKKFKDLQSLQNWVFSTEYESVFTIHEEVNNVMILKDLVTLLHMYCQELTVSKLDNMLSNDPVHLEWCNNLGL